MSNIDAIISDILKREGGYSNDPHDTGGRTNFGIAEASNPEAWADGIVTEAEARAIYRKKYVEEPGFHHIHDAHLMAQCVDFGVNSGPAVAIKKLQDILGVEPDGVIGNATLTALSNADARHVNNQLVVARVKMIGKIVVKTPSQLRFLNGWLNRALDWLK